MPCATCLLLLLFSVLCQKTSEPINTLVFCCKIWYSAPERRNYAGIMERGALLPFSLSKTRVEKYQKYEHRTTQNSYTSKYTRTNEYSSTMFYMENRPVDPGSIPGSLRPISFIRIKHRTRADDILCKTINNHIVGLVDKNHTRYYTNASDVPGSLPLGKLSFNYSNGCTHSVS